MSLSTLLGPALCTAHLFCVLGESLQRALRVHLPGAARPSLVQYQTSINLTTPTLQTSDSACTDEGALNLELLMTNHCYFSHSEQKSHTLNSFTLAGRRCFSCHLSNEGSLSRASILSCSRLPQNLHTSFSICLVLNSLFVSSM